jgi:hypothetical protein
LLTCWGAVNSPYRNARHALSSIIQQEGVSSLFRGFGASLLTYGVGSGSHFDRSHFLFDFNYVAFRFKMFVSFFLSFGWFLSLIEMSSELFFFQVFGGKHTSHFVSHQKNIYLMEWDSKKMSLRVRQLVGSVWGRFDTLDVFLKIVLFKGLEWPQSSRQTLSMSRKHEFKCAALSPRLQQRGCIFFFVSHSPLFTGEQFAESFLREGVVWNRGEGGIVCIWQRDPTPPPQPHSLELRLRSHLRTNPQILTKAFKGIVLKMTLAWKG